MAEIVAFPTDTAGAAEAEPGERQGDDSFLLDEGLEFLADYRAIADPSVRASLRQLVKSMARQGLHAPL